MARGKKTGGRKPGTPNKVTLEVKAACSFIVDDPDYRQNLLERARRGKLAPQVETMLWHYAKGVPKQAVDVNLRGDLAVQLAAARKRAAAGLLAVAGQGEGEDE